MNEDAKLILLGNIYGEQFSTGFAGNVWDSDGLCPTIKVESGGGGRVPMIVVGENDDRTDRSEAERTRFHG